MVPFAGIIIVHVIVWFRVFMVADIPQFIYNAFYT